MSQTHILSTSGYVLCRRDPIRGFITYDDYTRLAASNKIATRIKSTIKHSCGYREGGKCYTSAKNRIEAPCRHSKREASALCADCSSNLSRKLD